MICVLVERCRGHRSTRLPGVNLKTVKVWHVHNLDAGASAGPVPCLPLESIGTSSVCIVLMGAGMHVMLALAGEHGMQLECAPEEIFFNIVGIT
jgi:hypothetical protein